MPDRKFLVTMAHETPRTYGSVEDVLMGACQHARDRLLHACEAIAMMGGLALQRGERRAPTFSLEGARVQDARAGSGEHAAHVLPGQILVDGRPPWSLAHGEARRVAWLARFMVTSAVPAPFNTADSAAEQAGLKEAFRVACESAWTRAMAGHTEPAPVFETFLADADRAFLAAEGAKQGRRETASARGDARAGDERFVEALILRMYRLHGVTAREAARMFPMAPRPS